MVMSPQVNISPVTFGRLQRCAEPLVDDIESVINKLLDHYENKQGTRTPVTAAKIDAGTTPNLAWAKLLSGEVGGKPLKKVDWNALLIEAVEQAAEKVQTPEEVAELIIVPRVLGEKTDSGYRFIPSADVSIQGQDSNGAWKATAHIAKTLNMPVKVFFRWYENEKASNPGQTGKLSLNVE
jgi:hypothetical protein